MKTTYSLLAVAAACLTAANTAHATLHSFENKFGQWVIQSLEHTVPGWDYEVYDKANPQKLLYQVFMPSDSKRMPYRIVRFTQDGNKRAYDQIWALLPDGKYRLTDVIEKETVELQGVKLYRPIRHWVIDAGAKPTKLITYTNLDKCNWSVATEEELQADGTVLKRTSYKSPRNPAVLPVIEVFIGQTGGSRKLDPSLTKDVVQAGTLEQK